MLHYLAVRTRYQTLAGDPPLSHPPSARSPLHHQLPAHPHARTLPRPGNPDQIDAPRVRRQSQRKRECPGLMFPRFSGVGLLDDHSSSN
jgi:hypothetical protein